ncbi:MAG TPA: DNA polymerase III subunit gamma/tau [Armatimonadota bacterium]|nr:DNA polymerase III subunit gamma/tau [Armatimonadota bacterium]
MSTYISLYRKYRPQTFADVVGQAHITRTLQNALEGGRVAHAYLFCGPRGTGKTTTARLLAKALNCSRGPTRDPCNECESCRRIAAGTALDVIEIDAASNRGIDDIRELRDKVKYAPAEARHKVYVVDECHMLTTEAFNALLKTLEEPPAHVLFVLATTDPQKVPATILSRCQRMDFRRGTVSDLVSRLEVVVAGEGIKADPDALALIARSADGSWRDALSILEQIIAFGERHITADEVRSILGTVHEELLAECARAVAAEDATAALRVVAQLADEGKDIRDFLRGLLAHFRNLLLVGASGGAVLPDGATAEEARLLKEQAAAISPSTCLRAIEALSDAEKEMRRDSQHRLLLEIALLRMVSRYAPASPAAPRESAVPPAPMAPRPTELRQATETPAEPALRRMASPPPSPPSPPSPAPAPEAAPEPPPVAVPSQPSPVQQGQELDLDSVLARWALVMEHVGRGRLRGILSDVRPVGVSARELVLQVRQGYVFHQEQLEKPENIKVIAEAVHRALGVPLAVRVVMEGEAAGRESPPVTAAAPGPAAGGTPASGQPAHAAEPDPFDAETMSVKDVLDLFHGRVIQSKDDN